MNVAGTKKASRRFDTVDIKNLGIQAWGKDNLYPTRLGRILAASDTGVNCLSRYVNFIAGDGFKDLSFSGIEVNARGETMDDLLQLVAEDVARYRGLALHVTYNALGRVDGIYHVPFENCRLGQRDAGGRVSRVALHPDWSGETTFNGSPVKVTRENVNYFPLFDPSPGIVFQQMREAGGVEAYRGQVLWYSLSGGLTYPVPKYDGATTYMSTEEGVANTLYRNARNGLRAAGMIVLRKGLDSPATPGEERNDAESSIADAVARAQGDVNANNVLVMEIEHDEEKPEFVPLRSANYDKEFEVTAATACEHIYAIFDQDVFYRLRSGSSPFSNDGIVEAYEYYNSVTSTERRAIERVFDRMIKVYCRPLPVALTEIRPLKYNRVQANGNVTINTGRV